MEVYQVSPENIASRDPATYFQREVAPEGEKSSFTYKVSAIEVSPSSKDSGSESASQVISLEGKYGEKKLRACGIEVTYISRRFAQDVADITATALSVVPVPLDTIKLALADELGSDPDPDDKRALAQRLFDRLKEGTNEATWKRHEADRLKEVFDNWAEFRERKDRSVTAFIKSRTELQAVDYRVRISR